MKDQIRKILDRGKAENCSKEEEQLMLSLFHQPEKEFEVKEELFEELITNPSVEENTVSDFKVLFNKLWARIEKNKKRQNNNLRHLNNFLKLTAAVVVGLVAGLFITYWENAPAEPVYYSAHAPKGSVSEMILPDGSVIFLNADSRVRYSVDGRNGTREVFLEGEAWFDVEKDTKKPFLVHTSFYDVRVTGTQFNIKAYESDNTLSTTLEEGQIIIQPTENFKLAENIIINPGEQVVLNKTSNKITLKKVNPKWFTSWKDNKLIFINMNLKDLIVLLERKYGVEIEVKNKEILDLHFDGTIKNESIIEFLEIVQNTLPIHYHIIGQKIEITHKS
uniref:FecR family protein n=1 Tax=uncultured Draconibacterium sp. TaxID=1573823 RepID=UPI0032173BB4